MSYLLDWRIDLPNGLLACLVLLYPPVGLSSIGFLCFHTTAGMFVSIFGDGIVGCREGSVATTNSGWRGLLKWFRIGTELFHILNLLSFLTTNYFFTFQIKFKSMIP